MSCFNHAAQQLSGASSDTQQTKPATLGPPVSLDISAWVNSAVFVQSRWRSRIIKRQFLQQLREQGQMTPRLENLYYVTIPELCQQELERKKMRRMSTVKSISLRSITRSQGGSSTRDTLDTRESEE